MEVEQIFGIVNNMAKEFIGETAVVNEDLSNIVDVGKQIFDATEVDNYVKSLVNHIGKVIFVNRPYSGGAPSVLMDGWEYGSVLQKIKAEVPEAVTNPSWDLVDGESYDPNKFYKPKVSAKFFNSKVTFEVNMSFTEMQVKESFSSAEQLNGFISMLTNEVEKAMTLRLDGLIKNTINSMIADTMFDAYGANPTTGTSSIRAVNLLHLYNESLGAGMGPITPADALTDPEFIRFASYTIGLYTDRIATASKLFNMGGNVRFTSADNLHLVLLSEFKQASNIYLQSDTYNEQFTALPNAETVSFWQGSGVDYEFSSTSKINVKSASGNEIEADGIIGVMFDRDALGVSNMNRRVTTNYNPSAEFYTNFYKADAGYFNDGDENFVVFYVK